MRSPIHLQWIHVWIHVFHCIRNSHQCRHQEIATCNITQIIMRLKENHKFLVNQTPRSVLFFNCVISSFSCPKQIKKSALDAEGFIESRLVVTRTLYHAATWNPQVFSPKLEHDLRGMVAKLNSTKILARNATKTLPYCTSSNRKVQLRSPAHSRPIRKAMRQCQILVFLSFLT